MRRYLVLANQTLGGDELVAVLRDRVAAGPAEFWLVVPATAAKDLAPAFVPPMPVLGGAVAVPAHPEEDRRRAETALRATLGRLTAAGVTADGEVGDPDPMRAAEAALAGHDVDEIIVSTLPGRLSRWLHQDLPRRLEHRFHLPVTHVVVTRVSGR